VPNSMLFLLFALGSFNFGWAVANPYLVVYAVHELGVAEEVWPLMLVALFITTIVLAVPAGKIVDKFNRKVPLLSSFALAIVAMWFFVAGDLLKLFLSLVIFGVANVIAHSAYSALEADLTPREQRGKVSGSRNLLTYAVIGIGNFIGGVLYEHWSPQLPFFLAIIFFVPSFILTLTMVHEPEKREE